MGEVLNIACALWDANQHSQPFSRCYDEIWVEKLYRGFARNLTRPFRFVCFSEKRRTFSESAIRQARLRSEVPTYGCLIEPFCLDEPTIIVGLDTVIIGNIDHMADYCMTADRIALPRDPYQPERSINAVALVPAGLSHVARDWSGENDMEWLRRFDTAFIDDLWPGEVLSLKFHKVRDLGTQGARIIYFHGRPKPHELGHLDWVGENWR